ncbi:MAG: type II secretion system GspH family protein, partial [Muribaculaceae bacterium]|nr:type II secretion system GspH family protein [Muribaculaceae bacterium]
EVLITLGIIGVVAAMTIPNPIMKYQERQTIIKLSKFYATLMNAQRMAESEYGEMISWFSEVSDDGKYGKLFYDRLSKYMNAKTDCGYTPNYFCKRDLYPNKSGYAYKNGLGLNSGFTLGGVYGGMLADGTLWGVGQSIEPTLIWGRFGGAYAYIYVDINGYSNPNVLGKDAFAFTLSDKYDEWGTGNEVVISTYPVHPVSQQQRPDVIKQRDDTCLGKFIQNSVSQNYSTCTHWVLEYKNMDYLHCPKELYENGTHSCK